MAKSQKHSNREAKKPKQVKAAVSAVTGGFISRAMAPSAVKKGKS